MITDVGFIWDIDGVIVDSPHEQAWRTTAMRAPWSIDELSSSFYFSHVASKPRYEGGDNILRLKGVYERLGASTEEAQRKVLESFCAEKDKLIKSLIDDGKFSLFPDTTSLLLKAKSYGIVQAAASASKNAKTMLVRTPKARIVRELGSDFGALRADESLYSVFDVDVCGLDMDSKAEIQKLAATRLNEIAGEKMKRFVVFEDAPAGIEAAKSLGYRAIGVLRIGDEDALRRAGADIVVRDPSALTIEKLISSE